MFAGSMPTDNRINILYYLENLTGSNWDGRAMGRKKIRPQGGALLAP
jgi:hypothetical protein